jgi:hypothetical protein
VQINKPAIETKVEITPEKFTQSVEQIIQEVNKKIQKT